MVFSKSLFVRWVDHWFVVIHVRHHFMQSVLITVMVYLMATGNVKTVENIRSQDMVILFGSNLIT